MNETNLTYLFQSYFNKSATPDDREELMRLLLKAENDEQVKTLLAQTWQQFNSRNQLFDDNQGMEMLARILEKGANKRAPVTGAYKRLFSWPHIAAAAAILFIAFTSIYLWLSPKQYGQQTAQSNKISGNTKEEIVPGGNKAVLTLSDGSNIILDSIHQGVLTKQGNAKVVKLHRAALAYSAGDAKSGKIVYNTLSTPRGGEYQLILPDGTKVWLNASSSIYFPTAFKGKERNVTITGEAYFEVAKNAAMPFNVTVKDVQIQVLGTHFNIMAYDDENSMNTTLLEGSVKISEGSINKMLVPRQQSRINKTGGIKVVDADIEEVMAWKNGWFQFNSYDIKEIMREISRWYDVEVVYEGKIPTGHFSGLVSRGNDISQVLKIMQAGGVRFKIEGRKVIVLS